jgi:hypothetical protein
MRRFLGGLPGLSFGFMPATIAANIFSTEPLDIGAIPYEEQNIPS